MDRKRKNTSADEGDHVEKKLKHSIVTEDGNGTSSSEMTDREITMSMMPNGLPANCTENPEQDKRVHRALAGQSVQYKLSGNRTEIMMKDCNDLATAHPSHNEAAPTTNFNSISSDDEINNGDTTCFENSMGLLASTSVDHQQQQIFEHPVLDNHSLEVIDLTSEDDVMNSYYSIQNDEEIDETHSETYFENAIDLMANTSIFQQQQQQIFGYPIFDNYNLDEMDFTPEYDVMNSYYSIQNDEEIDETHPETYFENAIDLMANTSIFQQQQQQIFAHPIFDNYNFDEMDFTPEDDVMNSYDSIENNEEIDETRFETIFEETINSIPARISIVQQQRELFTLSVLDNLHSLNANIELTSDDNVINSHYSIVNDEDINEAQSETISEETIDSIPVTISIGRQQQQLFTFSVRDNRTLNLYIKLTSEDNGETRLETISDETIDSIPVRVSIGQQQHHIFTFSVLDNHTLNLRIELTSDDNVINSHYSIVNYEDIDEARLETISGETIDSIPERISIGQQQQRLSTWLDDRNIMDVIDLTSEDGDDIYSYYSNEHDDE